MCGFSIILILKGVTTFYSQRAHAFCVTKIQILIKTKRNRKWKILDTVLEKQTLCFSSCKNHKLKVKLLWAGAREKERTYFLYRLFFLKEFFFKICVLSQCILYWIHFQNIHTITHQKTLLYTLLLLAFKIIEGLQCILKLKLIFLS